MITSPDIVIPVSYDGCPKNKTFRNCPLRRDYIGKGKSVFAYSEGTLYLTREKQNSWEEIRADIEQMYEICTKCQAEAKQKTK